jgi:hypothetical protein
MSLSYSDYKGTERKPSRMLFDVIIKKHKSNMVILKYVIDEHILHIIQNVIQSYSIQQQAKEEE